MALARGNHDYVKLLMDYGVNMHEILTVGILEWLYGYQVKNIKILFFMFNSHISADDHNPLIFIRHSYRFPCLLIHSG